MNRGIARLENGDIDGAKTDLEKAVVLDPNAGELWRQLGVCKSLLKDLKGACSDFKKAAELGDAEAQDLLEKVCGQ